MDGAGTAPHVERPRPTPDGRAPGAVVPPGHRSSVIGLVVWGVALAAGTLLFHAMGDGVLAPPPRQPSGWGAWAEARDPLVATVAVLRVGVLALSWYLVGATSVGIVARLLRAARLVRLADALTVPALRRLLQGALGVSLATTMVVSAVPGVASAPRDTATVTLRAVEDHVPDPAWRGRVTLLRAHDDGTAPRDQVTLNRVDGSPTAPDEAAGSRSARPLPLELVERSSREAAPSIGDVAGEVAGEVPGEVTGRQIQERADEHRVAPGDSFWTIAEDVLTASLGRAPSEAATLAYWRELVAANRSRLVDPDNPDLIFPDQRFVLPAPAGDAG